MNSNFLFANKFKKAGWLIFGLGMAGIIVNIIYQMKWTINVFAIAQTGIVGENSYLKIVKNDIIDELILIFLLVGGLLIGFAKTKTEDELVAKIRYESLVWATYFNMGVMLFSTLFIYGMAYFQVLLLNVFSLLIFFIIRFHYKIYQLNKNSQDEE